MTTTDLLRLAASAALVSVLYATVWVVWVPWALLGRDHLAARRREIVRPYVEEGRGGPVTWRHAAVDVVRGTLRSVVRPRARDQLEAIVASDTSTWARQISRDHAAAGRRTARARRRGADPRPVHEAAAVVLARAHADRRAAHDRAAAVLQARHDRHLATLRTGLATVPTSGPQRLDAVRRLDQRNEALRRSAADLLTDGALRELWLPYVRGAIDLLGRGVTLGFVLGVAATGAVVPDLVVMAGWGGVGSLAGLVGASVLLVGLDLRAVAVTFGPDVPDTLRLATGHRLGPWFGALVPVVTTVATSAVLALR